MTTVVRFPNLTAKLHAVILTMVALAWHQSRLPRKYNHLYENLPRGNDWMVADNFAECFKILGTLKDSDLGEALGLNVKWLIGDIATGLFRRGVQTCTRITHLAQAAKSAQEIAGSPELSYFVRDLATLREILDCRKAFIPREVLVDYAVLSESIVAYIRGNPEAEKLNRKIRAITAPKRRVVVTQPAQPVEAQVPVQAAAAPVAEQTSPEPTTVAPEFLDGQ